MFERVSTVKHAKALQELQDLKVKYDREVAAHRGNCVRLNESEKARAQAEADNTTILAQVEAARYRAEEMVANVAIAFQYLHQVAYPGAVHVVPPVEPSADAVA